MQLADLPSPFGLVFSLAVKAKWHFHQYLLEYRTFGSCLIFAACGVNGSICSYLCHNSENFPGNMSFVPRLIRTEGFGKRRDLFKHNVGRKYFQMIHVIIWKCFTIRNWNKPFTNSCLHQNKGINIYQYGDKMRKTPSEMEIAPRYKLLTLLSLRHICLQILPNG